MFNIFHKIIITILIILLLNSCGYKADPFYDNSYEQQ